MGKNKINRIIFLLLLVCLFLSWLSIASAEVVQPTSIKNWRVGGGIYWEYDSNVILDYQDPDLVQDQDAHSFNILVEGAYYPLLSKHLDLGVALTLSFKALGEYTDHSYFFGWGRIIGQYKTAFLGMPFRILVAPGLRVWFVDHGEDEYTRAFNIPVFFTLFESPHTATEFAYTFEWEPFDDDSFHETYIAIDLFLRTNYNHTFGLAQYFYFMDYLGYAKVGADIRIVDATNLYDQIAPRVYGSLRFPIALPSERLSHKMGRHLFLDFFASYEYIDFPSSLSAQVFGQQPETWHFYLPELVWPANPIQADVKRKDSRIIVRPSLTYKFWGPLSLYLDYQLILNKSSDVFFRYIDHKTSIGVYFEF